MDKDKPLTASDYINRPLMDLMEHPGFSRHAFRVVNQFLKLTTIEIEQLDFSNKTGDCHAGS